MACPPIERRSHPDIRGRWPTSTLVAFHDDAPAAPRGRGLLRYSAGQRAPACFCTSYRICLGAAGAPSYPRPPRSPTEHHQQHHHRTSEVRHAGARSDSARPPVSISHLFIFLPALVWPGHRHSCRSVPRTPESAGRSRVPFDSVRLSRAAFDSISRPFDSGVVRRDPCRNATAALRPPPALPPTS